MTSTQPSLLASTKLEKWLMMVSCVVVTGVPYAISTIVEQPSAQNLYTQINEFQTPNVEHQNGQNEQKFLVPKQISKLI